MPAQLTATSTWPNFSFAKARAARTSFSEVTFREVEEVLITQHTHSPLNLWEGTAELYKQGRGQEKTGEIKLKISYYSVSKCFFFNLCPLLIIPHASGDSQLL